MTDTKMLQVILDTVRAVDKKVDAVDKKVDTMKKDMDNRFDNMDKRIDVIGLQLARLEDDAPTIEEFEKLVR